MVGDESRDDQRKVEPNAFWMPGGAHAWLLFVFCGEFGRHFFSSAPLYYLTNFSAEESDAIRWGEPNSNNADLVHRRSRLT